MANAMALPDHEDLDLTCPISLELLNDPITVPCCGRAFSRQHLIQAWNINPVCPICRVPSHRFDPNVAPRSVNLEYLIQKIINPVLIPEIKEVLPNHPIWKATITPIRSNNPRSRSKIGKLTITNTNPGFVQKTLLIPTVDESGSMSGHPNVQTKYSLHRIVDATFGTKHLMTHILKYSDRAKSYRIDTTQSIATYTAMIDGPMIGGGTSFTSAFNEIVKIIKDVDRSVIDNIIIIFLTDGEDSLPSSRRGELVTLLNKSIREIWNGSFTVHTVGFGASHDFDFLNKLRMIGTSEGAFRFGDPNEGPDSLSAKINSLLDVIAKQDTSFFDVIDTPNSYPKIGNNGNTYWVNIGSRDSGIQGTYIIRHRNQSQEYKDEIVETKFAEIENDEDEDKLMDEWNSYLIDTTASDLGVLNAKPQTLDTQLDGQLLLRRTKGLLLNLKSSSGNYERLNNILSLVEQVCKGHTINQQKLIDMKFEGKFATKKITPNQNNDYKRIHAPITSQLNAQRVLQLPTYKWTTIEPKSRIQSIDPKCLMIERKPKEYLLANITDFTIKDSKGSNILCMAAACGRISLVEHILTRIDANHLLNEPNDEGWLALDHAIVFGWWKTASILIEANAQHYEDDELLLRTCIDRGYINTANVFVQNLNVKISLEMSDYVLNHFKGSSAVRDRDLNLKEAIKLVNKCGSTKITIDTAIKRGMIDEFMDLIKTQHEMISWKSFHQILEKPNAHHITIIETLLKLGKVDVNEVWEINESKQDQSEVTWPLFIACEKGNMQLFDILMLYNASISLQNTKGTTVLWIASCNKHIDIVNNLLMSGANPNLANHKGDGPLIPACQKGADTIVQILLQAGVSINQYNKNRDNPVLICCRVGQAKILNILLESLDSKTRKEILTACAGIDGFDPLHASAEVDHAKCIEVLVKYGVNLESRTDATNPIIQGATSVHLAAFYGRVGALQTLVASGADILSQLTISGKTVMHLAIEARHRNVIDYLMSLPVKETLLRIPDRDQKLPIAYARASGNEDIMVEFFTDKISRLLEQVLESGEDMEMKCCQVIDSHNSRMTENEMSGRIIDLFDQVEFTNGESLINNAIFGKNQHFLDQLYKMGVDLYKCDAYGVPAMFWLTLLNIPGPKVQDFRSHEIMCMIDRVKAAGDNFQNRLLLNCSGIGKKCIKSLDDLISPITKMNISHVSGNNDQSIRAVLAMQKYAALPVHSIMGLFDKLKLVKHFPEGSGVLDNLITSSKLHLIRLVATSNVALNPAHIVALYMYCANKTILEQVNQCISKWDDASIWNPFIYTLFQGISALPLYCGEVYKTIDQNFDDMYAIDTILTWSAFSICSKKYADCVDMIKQNRGIVFIIHTKSGRDVEKFGRTPMDNEVIVMPGTKLRIVNHYRADQIALAQANIRQSTFLARQIDLEKASCGECIIVELEELSD